MIFASQMSWFPVARAVGFCLCQDEPGWLELNVGCIAPSGVSLGVHVCSQRGRWRGGAGGCAAWWPRVPAGRCGSQRQGKVETGGPQRPPTSSVWVNHAAQDWVCFSLNMFSVVTSKSAHPACPIFWINFQLSTSDSLWTCLLGCLTVPQNPPLAPPPFFPKQLFPQISTLSADPEAWRCLNPCLCSSLPYSPAAPGPRAAAAAGSLRRPPLRSPALRSRLAVRTVPWCRSHWKSGLRPPVKSRADTIRILLTFTKNPNLFIHIEISALFQSYP